MREIIFRGKDLQEHNGWLYGYFYKSDINKRERESGKATFIFTPNCDTFIYVPEYHNSWMVKAETVGQYTGLTDKNGARIFEGDILKMSFGKDTLYATVNFGEYNQPDKILRSHLGFYFDFVNTDNCESFRKDVGYWTGRTFLEIEVIGNIHDNPELLERSGENE